MRALLSRCFVGSLRAHSGPGCAPQNQLVTQVAAGRRLHLSRKSMQYLTEERGQPNSPDYRIYFSKFSTVTPCAHRARTLAFEWGRCDRVFTPSQVEALGERLTFTPQVRQVRRNAAGVAVNMPQMRVASFEGIYYFIIITTSDSSRGYKMP